ncbi:glycosyltransferase [Bacteroides pyogenes]|uniref:glycosyltransferase n=1 Tax=Bacteroides pyogenes TaxID=310300 RepID=UPI003B42E7DE
MNICFLSSLNPFDIKYWSGTLYHIVSFLAKQNFVEWVGNNMIHSSYILHSNAVFYPEFYAQVYGRVISKRINKYNYDVVIVRDYFFGAYLKVSVPIVYIGDTTFRLFKENLRLSSAKFEEIADGIEKKMIENADSIIFSSDWAKESAINDYFCAEDKIRIVEFGANIPHPERYQAEIDTSVCNLVFIGRNWEKKGGNKALGAYRKLKSEGFPCTLTIIGSTPPEISKVDKDLTIIPFLDKAKPEDLGRLCDILYHSHFLVLPTEFDAFGIVFCEASAYGVPSIAADVGGVSQPIREGKNGFLLPPNATAEDYAEKIKSVFSDKEKYIELRKSSRQEYETRLNWAVWGEKVNKILEKTVENYKKCANTEMNQCANEKILDFVTNDSLTIDEQTKEQTLTIDEEFYLPVYVINLKERIERRKHIEKQFQGKTEFALTWVEAVEHPIGAVGLWQSMVKAVQIAEKNEDDIMIICEDDHTFTPAYRKEYLLANIIGANEQGSELLSGGIGGFGVAVPVAANRYWVDWFWCTQFIVIFKPLFQKILDYEFKDTDTADGVLSVLARDKMTVYPFISIQKDFGYSDVTRTNNEISGMITNHFRQTDMRLSVIHSVAHKFGQKVNDK